MEMHVNESLNLETLESESLNMETPESNSETQNLGLCDISFKKQKLLFLILKNNWSDIFRDQT